MAILRKFAPVERVFFARWGFTHLAVVIAACFAAMLALSIGVHFGWLAKTGFFPLLVPTVVILGAGAVTAGRYARRLHPERLEAIGWKCDARSWRSTLAALGGYILLMPAFYGVSILWILLAPKIGFEFEPQTMLLLARDLSTPERVLALVLIAGLTPLLEEVLFRGFLQPLLVQNLREPGGIAITSLLFAALHGVSAFLPVFCLSLYLGTVQLQSQRLAASWAVHALHNALALLLVWTVPETLEMLTQ